MASPKVQSWAHSHKWSACRSRWFCFPFCRWLENGVSTISIKPPSLLSFLLGRRHPPNTKVNDLRDLGVPLDTTSLVHWQTLARQRNDRKQIKKNVFIFEILHFSSLRIAWLHILFSMRWRLAVIIALPLKPCFYILYFGCGFDRCLFWPIQ